MHMEKDVYCGVAHCNTVGNIDSTDSPVLTVSWKVVRHAVLKSKKAVNANSVKLRKMAFIYLGFTVTLCIYY